MAEMKVEPFNPLDTRNLGESVTKALLRTQRTPLPPSEGFEGSGV
jgi:hypothetical protein